MKNLTLKLGAAALLGTLAACQPGAAPGPINLGVVVDTSRLDRARNQAPEPGQTNTLANNPNLQNIETNRTRDIINQNGVLSGANLPRDRSILQNPVPSIPGVN